MSVLPADFVYSHVEWWIKQAQEHREREQPMLSFICAWIAFNHCYGLFWASLRRPLIVERDRITVNYLDGSVWNQDSRNYVPDNVQIAAFVGKHNPDFGPFWEHFKENAARACVQQLRLPILELPKETEIPEATPRTVKLVELDVPSLFRVLLTIRNNLFHGGKRFTSDRDVAVCSCAAEFMVPFVKELANPWALSEEEPD